MDLIGKLILIDDVKEISASFKKRDVVIETNEHDVVKIAINTTVVNGSIRKAKKNISIHCVDGKLKKLVKRQNQQVRLMNIKTNNKQQQIHNQRQRRTR